MADHRVQGVGGPEADESGDPAQRTPHQGADHGVGGVLRDGLHHRAGDLRSVQGLRVTAAQMGQPLPRQAEVPGCQRAADRPGLAPQRRTADDGPGGGGGQRDGGGGTAAQRAGGQCGTPAAPPAQTRVCRAPHPRWSRHRRRSTPAAARPKAATGCPRRGSPSSRSPIRPAVAPYAKMRSARTVQPAVAPRRAFARAAGAGRRGDTETGARRPGMAICPHSGSAPWFDVTGDESLLAPGSAVPPVFQPTRRGP